MKVLSFHYHPQVLLLHRFIKALGGNTPRPAIRTALGKFYQKPPLTLFTLSQVLQSLNIVPFACKSNDKVLEGVATPFIAMTEEGARSYFVIVENVESHTIEYYKTTTGLVKESLSSFTAKWTGIMLSAQANTSIQSELNYQDEEVEAIHLYKEQGIQLMDHFLSSDECDRIIEYAESKQLLSRSQVTSDGSTYRISTNRTSSTAFLDTQDNPLFRSIHQRAAAFLNLSEEYMENLQIIRYREGEEFKPHTDPRYDTDRKYTILLYLSEEFEGGETYFPELDLKIKPKKGRMLCFLNRDDTNQIISLSTHAGLPTYNGVKYGCNLWVGSPIAVEKEEQSLV